MRGPQAGTALGVGLLVVVALAAGGCTTGSAATPDASAPAGSSSQAAPSATTAEEPHVPARERGVLVDSPDAGPAAVLCQAVGSEDPGLVEQAFSSVHSEVDHVVLALYDQGRRQDAERVRTIKQDLTGAVADHDEVRLVDVARDLSSALSTATAATPADASSC